MEFLSRIDFSITLSPLHLGHLDHLVMTTDEVLVEVTSVHVVVTHQLLFHDKKVPFFLLVRDMGFHWECGHSIVECLTCVCNCGSAHMDISAFSMT